MKILYAIFGKLFNRKIGVSHEDDVDGIVSATLFLRRFKKSIIVLAQPSEIEKKPSWYDLITWDYVADLPCPRRVILYVDHHKSNVPHGKINFHDPNAPSAASLAIKALNLEDDEISQKLVELANDSDTGRYELKETWLLNDAIKGANYKGKIYLVRKLAHQGLNALKDPIIQDWIKRNRERRERTYKVANLIPIESILIVEFPNDLDLTYRGLCLELQKMGAHDLCAIVVNKKRYWRVYLGADKNSKYDCSIIARSLGGGGHKFAAGASVKNKSLIYRKLKEYLRVDRLKVIVVENYEIREIEV